MRSNPICKYSFGPQFNSGESIINPPFKLTASNMHSAFRRFETLL